MGPKTYITRKELPGRWERTTGERHTFQFRFRRAYVLEIEDIHFGHDSAVWIPWSVGDRRPTAFDAFQACYRYAKEHPYRMLLIVGHTDTTGSAAYNVGLSEKRSDSVLHLLLGNRDDWVKIVQEKNQVEDLQKILHGVDRTWGWGCDPGPIDNQQGPKTKKATETFQKKYNQEFDASLSVDGLVGKQTWGAVFDLYMKALAERLETDVSGLTEHRGYLQFLDEGRKAIGCGESWPIEDPRRNEYRSATNRRVEILFFELEDQPKLDCHSSRGKCDPPKCELYSPKLYRFEPIPVEPTGATVTFDIFVDVPRFLDDLDDRFQLVSEEGGYDRTLTRTQAEPHDERLLRLRYTDVGSGKKYTLYHCPTPDAKLPVFRDVPWEQLNQVGAVTPEPAEHERHPPEKEPEPQLQSGDALVLDHPADHVHDDSWYGEDPGAGTGEGGSAYA